MSTCASIGLGANLGDTRHTLNAAAEAIAALPGTTVRARSSLYQSAAWGVTEQPDFVNAVVMIDTALAPLDLLAALHQIEHQHGRARAHEQRWGPRTLDLDILVYGDDRLDLPQLRIPHPHLAERAFALIPLHEISPGLDIPGLGTVEDALLALMPIADPPIPIATPSQWSAPP